MTGEEPRALPRDPEAVSHQLRQLRADLDRLTARLERLEQQAAGVDAVEVVSEPVSAPAAARRPAVLPAAPSRPATTATAAASSGHTPADAAPRPPSPALPRAADLLRPVGQRAVPAEGFNWEDELGRKALLYSGTLVLLLAIGFAVHWAWQTFETPPWLQVTALHALGLVPLALALPAYRRGFPLLGQALLGLGIFTLYTVAVSALRLYAMWGESVAFAEMTLITAAAIAIALRSGSAVVIVLGALGGYLTPILTSSGSGDHVAWFGYLAFLNVALLACAVVRPWRFLKPLAVVATALMFALWIFSGYQTQHLWSTQWLVCLHAGLFVAAATLPPIAWKQRTQNADVMALAAAPLWFLATTWQLFHHVPEQQLAVVAWSLAGLHLALFAATWYRVGHVDRMPRVHLALAAVLFTLAMPLQLEDFPAYLGLSWCVQAVIFTGVGLYFRDRQMQGTALAVFALAAVRMVLYDLDRPRVFLGESPVDLGFLTIGLGGLLAMAGGSLYRLLPREELSPPDRRLADLAAPGLMAAGNLALLAAVTRQFDDRLVLILWTFDAAVCWLVGFLKREPVVRLYAAGIGIVLVGLRLFDAGSYLPADQMVLWNLRFASLLGVSLVWLAAGRGYSRLPQDTLPQVTMPQDTLLPALPQPFDKPLHLVLAVLGNATLFFALTFELDHYFLQQYGSLGRQERMLWTACYSILGAVYSGLLVAAGFRLRYAVYRWLGLCGFGLVVLKVFFVDLAHLQLMPRVLALSVVGMMLVGASLLYQKYAVRCGRSAEARGEPDRADPDMVE